MMSFQFGIGIGMNFGGPNILQQAMGMAGGGMTGCAGMSGATGMGGLFGADRVGFSQDAFNTGPSNFFHPLMGQGMGMGMPMMGMGNGMGMVPGMMGCGGAGGMQNMMMMQMMMQLLMMMMQMMQQNGMGGMGMPGMGMGMPGMGMGMPGMGGGFGMPMGMGMPGMGGGFGMPGMGGMGGFGGSGGVGMVPGWNPYGGSGGGSQAGGVGGAGGSSPISMQNGGGGNMASWIDNYLASKGSPAAGQGAGEMFVKYAKQHNIDPLVLLSISQHETGHGKLGVGTRKMLGVGAYDSNPNGKTKYDGLENQIKYGAKTFDNLRKKGGSNPNASVQDQLAAVNRAGWATDKNWHTKVGNHYNQIRNDAQAGGAFKADQVSGGGGTATGNRLADTAAQWNGRNFKPGQTKRCADFVSTMIQNSGAAPNGFKHEVSCNNLQRYGTAVGRDQLKAGDVVFFGNTYRQGQYTHTGIYLGEGKFVHRPTADKPVRVDNLNSGYYSSKFTGGRRLG